MTLPSDVSRCPGTKEPVCHDCLRKLAYDHTMSRLIVTPYVPVKGYCKHKLKDPQVNHKEYQ